MSTKLEWREERLEGFERRTEVPLLVLALLMIPLLLAPLVLDLETQVQRAMLAVDWLIWGVFAAELSFRVYLAPHRRRYLLRNWFDVLIVVLSFLRPLRIFRSARAARFLRGARVVAYLSHDTHALRAIMARRGVQGSLLFASGAVIASAITITFAESGAGGPIDGIDTAFWWALTTVTTVGYGDSYPVTATGRGVAAALMLIGVGLFGLLTANVAAYFVESAQDEPEVDDGSLDEVLAELRRLHDRLDAAGIAEGGAPTRGA